MFGYGSTRLGLQIQIALVAPAFTKMSWTCRHAWTNSPWWLPLACSDHGYHGPFISCPNRMPTGSPRAATSSAYFVMYASCSPLMMDARVRPSVAGELSLGTV